MSRLLILEKFSSTIDTRIVKNHQNRQNQNKKKKKSKTEL